MKASINLRVATTQSPTAAQFHGQASENSADTGVALFDPSRTSFEPQDGPVSPIQPANLPRLFRAKHLEVGTSQTKHYGNSALGIRTQPLVRFELDFNNENSPRGIAFQAWEEKMLIIPFSAPNNKIISGDVKTGVVSSIPAETLSVRTLIATQTGFALLWNGTKNGKTGEYLSHINARTNTISWTKLLSDDPIAGGFYLQETNAGELVAMCSVGEFGRTDKFQLFRFDADTGEQLGRSGDDAMVDFGGYKPQLSFDKQPVFFCDDTAESIVLAARAYSGDQRLVSVNFTEQVAHSVCDLPFTWRDFQKVAMRNGRVLILTRVGTKGGYDITFRGRSDYEIKPIAADYVNNTGSELVTNTQENFVVKSNSNKLLFYQLTNNGFELVESISPPQVTPEPGYQALAMTDDNIVYYSAVTSKTKDKCECRLFAYDAATREQLWSIDKTFDASASIAVNDDGSLIWFTATGGVVLEAP